MIYKTKPNIVIRKFDETNSSLGGYLLLKDGWVDEYDKILFDINSKPFIVLDYKEIPIRGNKLPIVLLDQNEEISEGDFLFTSKPIVDVYSSRKQIINNIINN